MFIDVTKISNKLGSEGVTINGEYRKKNITGLSVICDQNTLPLSVSTIDINRKLNNNCKTASHEIKNVQKTLDKINFPSIKEYVKINLIGDKGYITKNKFNVFNRNINIVAPKKKNQKIRTSLNDKILLRDRYKIEHIFAKIKSNNHLIIRTEKSIINYLSFIYISFLEIYIEYINKHHITLPFLKENVM